MKTATFLKEFYEIYCKMFIMRINRGHNIQGNLRARYILSSQKTSAEKQ